MSKNHKGVRLISTVDVNSAEYTTIRGHKIKLMGLPPFLVPDIYNSIQFPTPPTYEVEVAGGGKEIFPHEVTDTVNTLRTEEDKVAWNKYLEEKAAADRKLSEKLNNAILLEGVQTTDPPEMFEAWKRRQKLIGMELPEDEDQLLLLYKRDAIIGSIEEIEVIFKTVMELTGISTDEVRSTENSFPDSMESGT